LIIWLSAERQSAIFPTPSWGSKGIVAEPLFFMTSSGVKFIGETKYFYIAVF
jgi:hypothetical protein